MKVRLLWFVALALSACAEQPVYRARPPAQPYAPPPRQVRVAPAPARPPVPAAVARAPQSVPSAGPLRTAMIGHYMDAQERDLRQHLKGLGIGVARPGDEIVLSILADELFNDSGARLTGKGSEALATVAVIARHYDHTWLYVKTFGDTAGSTRQNWMESQKRAKAVADALIANGVNGRRIATQGFGTVRVKISNGAHVQEPRNRRIEIRIRPEATG
jgi:outer membrane protein OmpA-like peptidoglycan-associated protein